MAQHSVDYNNQSSYTLKDFKDNKDQIKKLAEMLPIVYSTHVTRYAIPGFRMINEGITHYKGEPVDPCKDYFLNHTDFTPIDLMEVLKNDFMDRGMPGLQARVKHIQVMHQLQKTKFPHLFVNQN